MYGQFTGMDFINPMRGVVHDPVTLTTLFGMSAGTASTIGAISTVAGAVLPVMGAIADVQAGQAQAAEHTRAAAETRIGAGVDAERMRKHSRLLQSRDYVSTAEAGALSGTGLGVLDQNAVAQELDALMVEYRGEQGAKGSEFQASQPRAGYLDVFSSAVGGFTRMDPLNLAPGGGAKAKATGGGTWTKAT